MIRDRMGMGNDFAYSMERQMDRLSAIEVFVRVVDTGSFLAVARLQNIGQPAVSKAVVQLEEWLGVSLLMRSTRSVTPTEAGRRAYATCPHHLCLRLCGDYPDV